MVCPAYRESEYSMSNIKQEDRATFTRTVTVEFEGDECPGYTDYSGRSGRASKVRLAYIYQFESGQWVGRAYVYWRWVLKSGDLGKDARQDTYSGVPWVMDLVEKHRPTSTIETKESK